jgi:hypothetical protein
MDQTFLRDLASASIASLWQAKCFVLVLEACKVEQFAENFISKEIAVRSGRNTLPLLSCAAFSDDSSDGMQVFDA